MKQIAIALFLVFIAASTATSQWAKLVGPDGRAEDYYGSAVAISGNTLVVGAPGDDFPPLPLNIGGAYVYVTDGTQWTMQQFLLGTGIDSNSGFGSSVAIDGNVIVVGAPTDSINGNRRGSAFVIERSGTSWFETAQLVSLDGIQILGERFGHSVAVSGDTIVVGAPLKDEAGRENQGAAYVFTRTGSAWIFQTKLLASDGAEGDQFGRSVAISGDNIIVGAIFDDPKGSAYIFARSGSSWAEKVKLTPSDTDFDFGDSVAISGGTAVVGAPSTIGSAYVFTNNGSTWPQTAKLTSGTPTPLTFFGASVSVSSGLIVVGADISGVSGAAYLFRRLGGRWISDGQLAAFDISPGANYGFAVAVSRGNAVVGARLDDIQTRVDQGSAFTSTGIPYRVLLSGRVLGPYGRGVSNAVLSLSNNQTGDKHFAVTNPFGYYHFADIPANDFTLSIASKRFTYSPRVLSLRDDLANVDITP